MVHLRSFVQKHRLLAAMVVFAALALRAAVPPGYMPSEGTRGISVTICSGVGGVVRAVTIPLPVKAHEGPSEDDVHQSPCAFSALGATVLGAAPPAILAAAWAFVCILLIRATPQRVADTVRWRLPPLRGPPDPY